MKLWYSPYHLKIKNLPNSKGTDLKRCGALIKIEHSGFGVGYADLHPSLELGDLSVEQQLGLYRQGQFTAQLQQSISYAHLDAKARAEKKALFGGLEIPKSHYLELSIENFTQDVFEKAVAEGFESFKFKVGRNLKRELESFIKISKFRLGGVKLRLDFNNGVTQGVFHEFWRALPVDIQKRIEFVEDPFVYDEFDWLRAEQIVPLALDRDLGAHLDAQRGYSIAIIKPALEDIMVILPKIKNLDIKYLFTSYLDHPIGQLFAALSAASCVGDFRRLDDGLITQNVFEKNSYFERLSSRGPWLNPQADIGIGFGDLLENEKWVPVYET